MATQIANIIFYTLNIFCLIVQLCVSVYVLSLIIVRRQIIRAHHIDYLLFANIYIAALFGTIFCIDISIYSIYGQIYVTSSFSGWWCRIKGYLVYLSAVIFFYTFALQAIYRFCRILYRTKARLLSFHLYAILTVSLWFLAACELLPSLLIGDIEYLVNDYHCQFAPTSIRGSLTVYSIGFVLPFSVTVFCYMWTIRCIQQQTARLLTINQRISMQRDVVILKRLAIFLSMVTTISAPHVILPIIYIIAGSLPTWIISVESLMSSLALLAVSIILLFTSPHLKKLHAGLHLVHPIIP